MIANLRDTTRYNQEQDWLKTNVARFFGMMQGQRDLQSLTDQVMSELTPVVGAQHGAFYLATDHGVFELASTYAYTKRKQLASRFVSGEGLVGQCAREKKPIIVTEVPDNYVEVSSGLGHAPPRSLAVYPVLFEDHVRGVIELGSVREFTPIQLALLEQLMLSIGLATNLIGTNMRTEQLLQQLRGSNVELDQRRKELEERAQLLEARNREIAFASASLESKSKELARVSQYKSEFLANMSHEIRTPLNSMMIMAQMLAANEQRNLTAKQEEWAASIHSAGRDLLTLINQILDLSRVEAVETAVLEQRGATVIAAANAQDGYAKLDQHPETDLVLMDIMMPGTDGYEATREIRKTRSAETLPIIALTAKASALDRAHALDAGCNDFLAKPADTHQIVATIVRNLRAR